MSTPCQTCVTVTCENPSDLGSYSLQDNLLYNARYVFIVSCPAGYICPPGTFPQTVIIEAGDFSVSVPTPGNSQPQTVRLQGCQSELVATVPPFSTSDFINSLLQSMMLAVAQQQAECNAIKNNNLVFATKPILNDLVSVGCAGDKQVNLIGDDYIIPPMVYLSGGKLWMKAGSMAAPSVAFANTAAKNFLNLLMASLVETGNLQCGYFNTAQSFTCPDSSVQTVAAGTVFSLVSQADADALALAQAESQCPALGLNFNNLVWGTPSIDGNASGSWVGNTFTGSSSATFNPPTGGGSADNTGSLTYTGVETNCNLHVVSTVIGSCANCRAFIYQDGNPILSSGLILDGTFDFPFTVLVSVGSVITVELLVASASLDCPDDSSVSCVMTLTPAF